MWIRSTYILQYGLYFHLSLLVLIRTTTRNLKRKYVEMSVSIMTTNDIKVYCSEGPRCDLNHRHKSWTQTACRYNNNQRKLEMKFSAEMSQCETLITGWTMLHVVFVSLINQYRGEQQCRSVLSVWPMYVYEFLCVWAACQCVTKQQHSAWLQRWIGIARTW